MNRIPEKKTLDFNTGAIKGIPVDSGGYTYSYLMKHPDVKLTSIDALYSHQLFLADRHINRVADSAIPRAVKEAFYVNLGFNAIEIAFLLQQPDTFEFYLDRNFIHYRDGSNDNKQSQEYHCNKLALFSRLINDIVQE